MKLRPPLLLVNSLLLFLAILSPAVAQRERRVTQEPTDVIKVNTDLVVFDVQVIDKKTKNVIADLKKEDFSLLEDGVKQQISYFSRDELSLSVLILLDVSGSVRDVLHQIRDGALNALARLRADDQVAVMAFASRYDLIQDFTKDRRLVSRKIEEATETDRLGSGTLLSPALDSAAIRMHKSPSDIGRRAIIVITDNLALVNSKERENTLEELSDSGTVVYGLIVKGVFAKMFGITSLGFGTHAVNDYVEETGGEIVGADKKEVAAKLATVIDRLRARYAVGFRPANTNENGTLRHVEIKVTLDNKRKEKPVVLSKHGYYFRRH